MNCKCCGAKMKALFTSVYCPNECDKPLPKPKISKYFLIDLDFELPKWSKP